MTFAKKIKISIVFAIVISVVFSIYTFAKTSEKIRNDFIRLHVIANSDTDADQELKLQVRDFMLNEGSDIFDGTVNTTNVYEKIPERLPVLEEKTEGYIKSLGYNYKVKITLEKEYFTTRTYSSATLPAGKYTALKVIIGEGEGRNWWCVMFPPMCISAADEQKVLNEYVSVSELKLISRNPQFEVRFKIVEIIEEIKQNLNDRY